MAWIEVELRWSVRWDVGGGCGRVDVGRYGWGVIVGIVVCVVGVCGCVVWGLEGGCWGWRGGKGRFGVCSWGWVAWGGVG